MLIERAWAMPNKWTFTIKPIKKLLQQELDEGQWIEPFSGKSKLNTIKNDIDPNSEADYHIDALDFLKGFDDNSVHGVLFDPPYSVRQVSECYKKHGYPVTMETTQSKWYADIRDQIARVCNNKVISFGWNSNGIGKTRGFELNRILLIAHGGPHNDTIVTVERNFSSQGKRNAR